MADPMTPALDAVRREELRAKALTATPGPWTWGAELICQKRADDTYKYLAEVPSGDYDSPRWNADAAYIAAMSPDTTLALLAYIAELEAGLRVKPLDWKQHWPNDPLSAFTIAAPISRAYTIEHDSPRFYVTSRLWPVGEIEVGVANCSSFEKAKAAAQADYESRILAALLPKASVREERDSHDINRKPTPEGK